MITFQRFDDEKVNRKPDRPAPVRIAAEQITRPLARNVVHAVFVVAHAKDVRMIAMDARDGAQTVGREEFVFIEHVAQGALQSLACWNRQHAIASERTDVAIRD